MAKIKQVLKHVCVETAKRKRMCHRDRDSHEISSGTQCLVIKDEASSSKRNPAQFYADRPPGDSSFGRTGEVYHGFPQSVQNLWESSVRAVSKQ